MSKNMAVTNERPMYSFGEKVAKDISYLPHSITSKVALAIGRAALANGRLSNQHQLDEFRVQMDRFRDNCHQLAAVIAAMSIG